MRSSRLAGSDPEQAMPIEARHFSPEIERQWDDFVERSDNGTLFHLRKFLNYHPPEQFTDASLVFLRKDRMCAVFPAAVCDYNGERVLFSHRGASYGGIVFSETTGLQETFKMVNIINRHAEELQCDRIIITQTPAYYYARYSSYVDFALKSLGFTYRFRELSSVISLNQPAEAIYRNFPDVVKRAIRKAEKSGLRIYTSLDIKSYYEILKNNLEMRHNVSPTHTLDELERLFAIFPDRIKLYAAELKGEMIGGIVTFACNARVNLAFYIAHNHEFQNIRPVDLIIWHLIQESIRQGYLYLDFGIFTLRMEPNWGLCRFKEKFGALGIFRDTFERRLHSSA